HGKPVPVEDPYNLYFTKDGRYAIVVAERLQKLDFRDAHSMKLSKTIATPCRGVDHMDFTASGRYALVSCEFSGQMLKLDVARRRSCRSRSAASSRDGASPEAARTWAACRRTARCCGCRAATTPRCTRSARAAASCSHASRWAPVRTACACTRSRGGTRWGTP